MKKKSGIILIPLLAVAIICGCVSGEGNVQLKKTDLRDAEDILKQIESVNRSLPASLTAKISVVSKVSGRSFRTSGSINYTAKPELIKVTMIDLIFRSTVAEILLESGILKIYVPIDKALYIREKNTDGLAAASLEINPDFVSQTALGRIPMIAGYSVTKSYASEKKGTEPASNVIVLENDSYFESISVKDGLPDKVRILSKRGSDKFEAHYSEPVKQGEILFYKKIKAFSENTGNSFEIEYSGLVFNVPIDSGVFTLTIPKGTKIVR